MEPQIRTKTISEWMKTFSNLYSEADAKRTPEQMWMAVMAHTSSIGESIRRVAFERLLDSAAHTFCWLCSFVNKCATLKSDVFSINETLCGIVSLKYPMVCGHCKQSPCQCDPVKMDKEEDKRAAYRELFDRRKRTIGSFEGFSIEDCMKIFGDIYGGRIHIQTLENIGFHFLEEIGEAAVSIRKLSQLRKITDDEATGIDSSFLEQLTTVGGIVDNYANHSKKTKDIDYASRDTAMLKARLVEAKMGMIVEIADSFSWFCAILNKLGFISRSILDHPEEHPEFVLRPLEKVLIGLYFDDTGKARCPNCKSAPCKCTFYNLAPQTSIGTATHQSRKGR
jgi:hypothetical protein